MVKILLPNYYEFILTDDNDSKSNIKISLIENDQINESLKLSEEKEYNF